MPHRKGSLSRCGVSRIRKSLPVKLICGVTYTAENDLHDLLSDLETVLGCIDDRSESFDFSFTSYYEEEMGKYLLKCFLSFRDLMPPEKLPSMKLRTNEIEDAWSKDGKRRVNLDPGYLTGAKLVLASAKDFAHRLFLSDGIYGDVQLQYARNRFNIQPWTYPDYQTETAIQFFEKIRQKYLVEVRQHD